MIFVKRAASLVLALCMVLSLAACGSSASSSANSANSASSGDASVGSASSAVTGDTSAVTSEDAAASTGESEDDGRVTYTITVVDENGAPISGAMVQLCKETCLPCGATDADGVVTVTTIEDDYKVSFMTPVAGYVTDGLEFYFDAGSTEMTIILTAAE